MSRRTLLGGLLAAGATAAAPALAAPSLLNGRGDFRAIRLSNAHTEEWVSTVYWVEGAYIPEALGAINRLMRDWREDAIKPIAPATIDIVSRVHALLDCDEPFQVISGYRTPQTNAMLRSRSRGVARNSYHVRAMAVDLALATRSVRQIGAAAESLGAGGVGRYSRSDFVHVDSGPVRTWGR